MAKLIFSTTVVLLALFLSSACSFNKASQEEPAKKPSLSEQVGKMAYKANKQAEKGAKAAAKDLSKAADEARKGWKEAAKQDGK